MQKLGSGFKVTVLAAVVCGCGQTGARVAVDPSLPAPVRLVGADDGERLFLGREREPTLIKVDSATVGARELFVFQRVLDPGATLGRHKHRDDEIIFVHSGEVLTTLGGVDRLATTGSTIFVPGDAWMDVRNAGTKPATLLIIFSAPHMAEYIRALGTRPGDPKRDLTPDFLRGIADKHGITFAAAEPQAGIQRAALQAALVPHYRFFRPAGDGPFRTVLFISGCSGFEHPRAPVHYTEIARRFTTRGRAVVFADYVRARDVPQACNGVLSPSDVGRYVLAALAYLRDDPKVERSGVDIVGWSLGGGGVLAALAALPQTERAYVRSAVVLYPDCTGVQSWSVAVPTMVVFAGKDAVQPPVHCERIARDTSPAKRMDVRTFPDAHHGFDMHGLPETLIPGLPALAYDRAAADSAWVEIDRFLGLPAPQTDRAN